MQIEEFTLLITDANRGIGLDVNSVFDVQAAAPLAKDGTTVLNNAGIANLGSFMAVAR